MHRDENGSDILTPNSKIIEYELRYDYPELDSDSDSHFELEFILGFRFRFSILFFFFFRFGLSESVNIIYSIVQDPLDLRNSRLPKNVDSLSHRMAYEFFMNFSRYFDFFLISLENIACIFTSVRNTLKNK